MPGKRAGADRRLEAALEALAAALEATGAPWMIIGGIAVIARGVRRMTVDVDAVVRGDAVDVPTLLITLARHSIRPRVRDAASFAAQNLVVLARHAPTGVDLDISLGWSGFEHSALAARAQARFGRVRLPFATPEDLVVFKLVAARPRDLADAEALLLLHPSVRVRRIRERVAELAELADAPEIVAGLEAVLGHVRRLRRARPKT